MNGFVFEHLEILRADEEQLNDLALLFDAYRVFYGWRSDMRAAVRFLRDRIGNDESIIFIAYGDRGEHRVPLGFTQLYPMFSSVSMRSLWVVNDLYVAPEGRRQGIGRALLERARRHAVDTNAKGLVLETAVDNEAARALYESCGWERDTQFYRYALDV